MTDKMKKSDNGKPSVSPLRDTPSKRVQREAIGQELRRMFDDVAAEPIPDDFAALIASLERKEMGQ